MAAERGEQQTGSGPDRGAPRGGNKPPRKRGKFEAYKPEQGKKTRWGTMIAFGALIAWGTYFVWEQLQVFEGDDQIALLVTAGVPLLFAVVCGAGLWWVTFSNRPAGDFFIATEGEMKKVSWSTRREVIGSTKVVILFTIFISLFLFVVDLVFQFAFRALGVLKG